MELEQYTDQQARYALAFTSHGTSCSVTCEACNRTYFVTSPGHGDYEDGELEGLRARAESALDRYIEVPDFDSVSFTWIGGKQVVVGCLCDPTKRHSEWIEAHAEQVTAYLVDYWTDKKAKAEHDAMMAERQLQSLSIAGASHD